MEQTSIQVKNNIPEMKQKTIELKNGIKVARYKAKDGSFDSTKVSRPKYDDDMKKSRVSIKMNDEIMKAAHELRSEKW